MTYSDIFIQVLHEISGQPKEELAETVKLMMHIRPGSFTDADLSDDEAARLLDALRQEKAGIRAWMEQGAAMLRRHTGSA